MDQFRWLFRSQAEGNYTATPASSASPSASLPQATPMAAPRGPAAAGVDLSLTVAPLGTKHPAAVAAAAATTSTAAATNGNGKGGAATTAAAPAAKPQQAQPQPQPQPQPKIVVPNLALGGGAAPATFTTTTTATTKPLAASPSVTASALTRQQSSFAAASSESISEFERPAASKLERSNTSPFTSTAGSSPSGLPSTTTARPAAAATVPVAVSVPSQQAAPSSAATTAAPDLAATKGTTTGFFSKSFFSKADEDKKHAAAAAVASAAAAAAAAKTAPPAVAVTTGRGVNFVEPKSPPFGPAAAAATAAPSSLNAVPLSARTARSEPDDTSRSARQALAFTQPGVLDWDSSSVVSGVGPSPRPASASVAASGVSTAAPADKKGSAAAAAPTSASAAKGAAVAAVAGATARGSNNSTTNTTASAADLLDILAQPFVPGSVAAMRAQRSAVSVGFSGACSGALVEIDGAAWCITSSDAVFDPQANEYLKLGQLAVRSPCIPMHCTPDGLFVCGATLDAHHATVALLRFGDPRASSMLLKLCVKLSQKVCALHTTLRGFQVELPISRRIFDEDSIFGQSSISAVSATVVQMRSEFTWRALPDTSSTCNAVAGACLYDEVGDVVAVMVGVGAMLSATSYHTRWDTHRGVLASDSDMEFLHRDFQVTRLRHHAFLANGGDGAGAGSGAAAGGRSAILGRNGKTLAPEFVNKNIEWNEATLTTLECAVALDEMISNAARAVLNRAPAAATAAGPAGAPPRPGLRGGAASGSASPFAAAPSGGNAAAAAAGGGSALSDLQNFAPMPQPSGTSMSLATALPRLMRLGTQPASWVFVHAREAARRMSQVNAGSLRVAHSQSLSGANDSE